MKRIDLPIGVIHADDSHRTARLVLPKNWSQAVAALVPEPFASNRIYEPRCGPHFGRTVRDITSYPAWTVVAVMCYGPEALAHPMSCRALNKDYVACGCRPAFSGLVIEAPEELCSPNPLDGYWGEFDLRLLPSLGAIVPLNLICAIDSVMSEWPKGENPVKWGYTIRIGQNRLRRWFDKPNVQLTERGLKGGVDAELKALEAVIRN